MSTMLLERGVPPEQQKAVVARVGRAVQRVQHLVADLLDFTQARLGSGLSVRKESVDLHQAIADGVAELAVAFADRTLRHERSGDSTCDADANRFRITVHNGGKPIPAELLPRLFEPMVRGSGSGSVQGVGLGPYIVREIVRAHGAQVGVISSAEAGTAFTLDLPGR